MIRYLLDTDVVSQASKEKPNRNVMAWLDHVNDDELAISVITLRERLEGVANARRQGFDGADEMERDVEKLASGYAGRILPMDEAAARHWAALLVPDRSHADDKAQVAIARANGLALVTLNWRHAQGTGVEVINPSRRPPKSYPS